MGVVYVDLRDASLRSRLSSAPVGEIVGGFYSLLAGASIGSLVDVPVRLLIVLPIDDRLREDAEQLALALLGVDPQPRTIVVAVNTKLEAEPERDPTAVDRVLPNEFGRQPDVRFLDLRGSMLSIGHPRTGAERVGTGERDPWVREFARDLLSQLRERDVFDAIWSAIPQDRPATVGMRIASLGTGRDRAVADIALRLAEELRPDREPDTGHRLPERWTIEAGLLPSSEAHLSGEFGAGPPKSVTGLAKVAQSGVFAVLRRDPDAYNRAAAEASSLLTLGPEEYAKLFENAAGHRDEAGGPWIDPIGAAVLDRAMGGVIFGDEIARAAEEGEDATVRVGEMLELAAERQAEGLSAAVLAHWLREDAASVAPVGPAAVAARLRAPEQPWATLHDSISRPRGSQARTGTRGWVSDALNRRMRDEKTAFTPTPIGTPEADVPAWQVPRSLRWVLGSPIWRHRSLAALYIMVTSALLLISVVQFWADSTGFYLVQPQDLGVDTGVAGFLKTSLTLLAVALVGYLLVSIIVAIALRRWAQSFRFDEIPMAIAMAQAEARDAAVMEVARCTVRRDYARVARAAADTLEAATAAGANVARAFGEATISGIVGEVPAVGPAPHRNIVGPVAGTDAGGIYRIYPLYVQALRSIFAASLVDAIRERWPRIRGVFWQETEASITELVSRSLQDRLSRVLEFGIQRGDLLRNGIDPADGLAEQLWTDPAVREAALRALNIEPHEPMPILATPADSRLLDDTIPGSLILAVPATLEPLVRSVGESREARVVVTNAIESAAVLRIFPFQPGLYDMVDFARVPELAAT